MGKIIKFNQGKNLDENIENKNIEKDKTENKIEDNLKPSIENYLKSTFAIKNIIELAYVEKINNFDIGFIGGLVYEHKRKPGVFVANFIGYAVKDKNNNYRIIEIAFEAGEPHLYRQIENILKAKSILPIIKH